MDRNSLIAKIEAAYTKAEVRGATDDMLKATSQLLQIWVTERDAQVPAALGSSASTSTSYSVGQNFSYSGPGPCTCGAEEGPGAQNGCAAGTPELHSGGYDFNGDESV